MLKNLFGRILILSCIPLGIYIGFWLLFIGGIVQIIDTIKYDTSALAIGIGFIKIWSSAIVGWLSGTICFMLGAALLDT